LEKSLGGPNRIWNWYTQLDQDADPSRRLWPGALVELAAEGIGTLRNRIATR